MKYLLCAQLELPEKITSWEMYPEDGRDVGDFFRLCLGNIEGAKVNGFAFARLGGQDLTQAIENCETVAEGPAILRVLT